MWKPRYVILHHANVFVVEYNILRHYGCPFDYTGSHENWFQGYKMDLITHPTPCDGYSFFPRFSLILLIFMNMQMR